MGRQPCCDKVGLKKGSWTADEDTKLVNFILTNGQCCWRALPKLAGLMRCGKSCRLRWTNYLRPDVKRGLLSDFEEKMVIDLHAQLGNRWSKIASHLPGRTDNEIKNYWNTHIKKKLKKMGIDPLTHKPLPPPAAVKPPPEAAKAEEVIAINISEFPSSHNGGKEILELGNKSNDFCIDEIPVMEPHEILLSCNDNRSSSSSSPKNVLKGPLFLASFDDYYSEMDSIWPVDFDGLDLMMKNDDYGRRGGERKRVEPSLLQYPILVMDEECS